jgi:hypothetical protein
VSSAGLAVLIACLLALCAWFLVHTGTSTRNNPAASQKGEVDGSAREVQVPDEVRVALEIPEQTLSAGIEPSDPADPELAEVARPQTLVYGSLVDSSGAPIQGAQFAEVSLVDHTGRRRSADARQEGAFALSELDFGTYWVTANADGYRSLDESFELRPDLPRMRKDFTLQESVELRVKVETPQGKNLFDVLKQTAAPAAVRLLVPVATREVPGKRIDEVIGDSSHQFGVGRFQNCGPRADKLAPDCMGVLSLDCDLPVYVSLLFHNVVLQTKRVTSGADDVVFVLSPADLIADLATVRVRVVDGESGLPIEHAMVTLRGGTFSNIGEATDARGVATIERREPGLFEMQIAALGHARFHGSIDASPGEITDLGTVVLAEEVKVEGRVVDLEGHALAASFALGILDPAQHSVRWLRQQSFRSNGDGSFDIRGLGRAEYVIRTDNHDALDRGAWEGVDLVSGNVPIDARGGSVVGLEVRLRPASKLVLQNSGWPAGAIRFSVADERGLELVGSTLHGSAPRPLSLPAGNYGVSLLDPQGFVLSERSVTLAADTVTLDVAR